MAEALNDKDGAVEQPGEPRLTIEQPPSPEAPNAPAIAADAVDLKAIRSAVVDAAGVSAGLWLSYLFVLFYLLIAAGGITHRDLFLASPIKLPFLSVELPLIGFFSLGPALFLVVHAYVLLHFVLLSSKAGIFDAQLRAQIDDAEVRAQLRRQLPINIFVQFQAGPREVRQGPMGFLLRLIAWISLMIGPVALLVFFELQFLPYHEVWITMWQRIAVVIDLLLLWLLWPAILRGEATGRGWRGVSWGAGTMLAGISIVSIVLVFAIATFRGEWLEAKLAWFPLRKVLLIGDVNPITLKSTSLWSNHLVLTGYRMAIDHPKFDTEAKVAAAPEMFRGRHLEDAVLTLAVLQKVDFTGAYLQGASLDHVQLQGAVLNGAQLHGANLWGAQLQGAVLNRAQLQGAFLVDAKLQGAALDNAQLQGATLTGARLQAASLRGAQLQGASLFGTYLQGAFLDGAQLQGAELEITQLQGASLKQVFAWRADAKAANVEGARITAVRTGPRGACRDQPGDECDWGDTLNRLRRLFEQDVPESKQRTEALAAFERRLDPAAPRDEEIAKYWIELQNASPEPMIYEEKLADLWHGLGCAPDGAPFVLTGLVSMIVVSEGRPFTDNVRVSKLAADFLKEDCAGARGISEDTRRRLFELRDAVP